MLRSSLILQRRSASRRCSWSHLAEFSVSIPSSPASTSAAAAEGARPSTEPGPCSASHTARSPAMVVDLPVPAGPTKTSRRRLEVAICSTAMVWSRDSLWSRPDRLASVTAATVPVETDGPPIWRPASSRRDSTSKRVNVV